MQMHQKTSSKIQWLFYSLVLLSIFGCSSVAKSFMPVTNVSDQFSIKVFQGTFSSKSDESVIDLKAKEFASQNGYSSYEILPGYTSGYGQPTDSDRAELVYSLMGAKPQFYKLYAVKFKR